MRFEEINKDTQIRASVRHKSYAISKVKEFPKQDDKIFAVITDGMEISVVAESDLDWTGFRRKNSLRSYPLTQNFLLI